MKEKKNYYMRVEEHFYDSDGIKYIQSMKYGYHFSDILIKLYLCSIKDDGFLAHNGRPYSVEKLSVITGHSTEIVKEALKVLREEDFIGITENGTYYIIDFQNHVGSSTSEAERKRKYRERIDAAKSGIEKSSSAENIRDTETEMSHDKNGTLSHEKHDISDKETDKDKESDKEKDVSVCGAEKTGKGKKAFAFVPPTLTELTDYAVSNGIISKEEAERCFYYYDSQSWKKANGQKVSSWKGCVRTWGRGENRSVSAQPYRPQAKGPLVPSFDYSSNEGCTL